MYWIEVSGESTPELELNKHLIFKTHSGYQNVPESKIWSCSADGSYTIIRLICGKNVRICMNLKTLEQKLNKYSFIRCHNKWILNMKHINYFSSRKRIIIALDIEIPISRRRAPEVITSLLKKNIQDKKHIKGTLQK